MRAINYENITQLKAKLSDYMVGYKKGDALSEQFKADFFKLVELVTFSLMHREDNFFGSCLIQMKRDIRMDITSAVGVSADLCHFNLHFNPRLFLSCTIEQMKGELKHQIYHIMLRHIERGAALKNKYSPLIISISMDIAINQYIEHMPAWAMTIRKAEEMFDVRLPLNQPFEVYCQLIQQAVDKKQELVQNANCFSAQGSQSDEDYENKDFGYNEVADSERTSENRAGRHPQDTSTGTEVDQENQECYDQASCHDIWQESNDEANFENIFDLTKKMAKNAARGTIPAGLVEAVAKLNQQPELRWQDILKKIVGTLPVPYKRTITRKDRRQPDRLDLRGKLPNHIVNLLIAIDTSGSMKREKIEKALAEVFDILKKYPHHVTIIECDAKIQQVYQAKSPKDLKYEIKGRGGTKFSPVFEYIHQEGLRNHLLIYFTDGSGEKELTVKPKNFRTIWVLAGKKDKLSLEGYCGIVKHLEN